MWSDLRELLIRTARELGDLRHEFVFVGGSTTGLLITDPAAADVRPTKDVDVIVEITSRAEYYAIGERLRSRGFQEDRALLCRWQHRDGITLDVMPTDEKILGFSNRWYHEAVQSAVEHELEAGLTIRVVTPPYFCAGRRRARRQDAATPVRTRG